jgi:hypothetical protein
LPVTSQPLDIGGLEESGLGTLGYLHTAFSVTSVHLIALDPPVCWCLSNFQTSLLPRTCAYTHHHGLPEAFHLPNANLPFLHLCWCITSLMGVFVASASSVCALPALLFSDSLTPLDLLYIVRVYLLQKLLRGKCFETVWCTAAVLALEQCLVHHNPLAYGCDFHSKATKWPFLKETWFESSPTLLKLLSIKTLDDLYLHKKWLSYSWNKFLLYFSNWQGEARE